MEEKEVYIRPEVARYRRRLLPSLILPLISIPFWGIGLILPVIDSAFGTTFIRFLSPVGSRLAFFLLNLVLFQGSIWWASDAVRTLRANVRRYENQLRQEYGLKPRR